MLRATDTERLAAHFSLETEGFLERFASRRNGKWSLRAEAGLCVFYGEDGCGVHAARPDICRAWPFFRGNLVDAASLAMAREYCPGIDATRSHAAFVLDGMRYLALHGLACLLSERDAPSALCDCSSSARPAPFDKVRSS